MDAGGRRYSAQRERCGRRPMRAAGVYARRFWPGAAVSAMDRAAYRSRLAAIVIQSSASHCAWTFSGRTFAGARSAVTLTAVAVIVFGMLDGLLAAIAFSLAMLLHSCRARACRARTHGAHDFVSVGAFRSGVYAGILVLRPESLYSSATPTRCCGGSATSVATDRCAPGDLSLEESPDLDGTRSRVSESSRRGSRYARSTCARATERGQPGCLDARRLQRLPLTGLDYSSVDDAASDGAISP